MDRFETFLVGGLVGVILTIFFASIMGIQKEYVVEQYKLCLESGASVEYCEKI